nr:autotransporter domain-containing protein [Stenotrophomonas sp. SY1]
MQATCIKPRATRSSGDEDRRSSLVGRLSGRLSRNWNHADADNAVRESTARTRISVRHEFRGNPITEFSSNDGWIPFRADMGGTWWEVEIGLTGEIERNLFVQGNLGYLQGRVDDRRSWKRTVGIHANW